MPRQLIAEHLKKAMGLHAPTVGMMTVSSAIDKRMRTCGIDSDSQYLSLIISSQKEMEELTEVVLIPETWFFRESQPYEYVLRYFKENSNTDTINILSMPCSTGEEPYSVAMLLMDNNIPVDGFSIDAVDIGENNIAKAQQGQYRKNSFRADDLSFMEKYFHEEDNLFNIAGFVKNKVNFHRQNVLSDSLSLTPSHYDIVFCRNLLIYFDPDTQRKMFSVINNLLKPNGLLILGHAETIQWANGLFVPAIDSKSYIYVKESNHEKSLPVQRKNRREKMSVDVQKTKPIARKKRPFQVSPSQKMPAATKTASIPDDKDELDLAFSFADEGKLNEALDICNQYINNHNDSSKAHYLRGVIFGTKGDLEKADESLHKSIYLDPHNINALVHLSLIAEQRGNHDEASQFKKRAQRIQDRLSA